MLECLGEREKRRHVRPESKALAKQHTPSFVVSRSANQARLADTRFAVQQHQARIPRDGRVGGGSQEGLLTLPFD